MSTLSLSLLPTLFNRSVKKCLPLFLLLLFLAGCSGTEFPNPGPTGNTTTASGDSSTNSTTADAETPDETKKRGLLNGIPLFAYLFNPCLELLPFEDGKISREILFTRVGSENDLLRITWNKDQNSDLELSYGLETVRVSYDNNDSLSSVVTGSENMLSSLNPECVSERRVAAELNDNIVKEFVFSTSDKGRKFEFTTTIKMDATKRGAEQILGFTISVKEVSDIDIPATVYDFKLVGPSE